MEGQGIYKFANGNVYHGEWKEDKSHGKGKYIFKNGYRYQKAGIMLSGLCSSQGSKNLFSSIKDNKIKNLMKSIDNTNYRFGRSTLSLASAGINKKWNIKKQYSSKIDKRRLLHTPFFHMLGFLSICNHTGSDQ